MEIVIYYILVFFIDSNTGWAVGYNEIDSLAAVLKTTNGGTNWIEQTISADTYLHSVYFTDSNTGWAVGASSFGGNGKILKTTDGGLNWVIQKE